MKQSIKYQVSSINSGFTLIELLITIAIIGILVGISIFGLQGARESARDSKRKSDLELIRSGIETYRSDCNAYPATVPAGGAALVGTGTAPCLATNTYISAMPQDPTPSTRTYKYAIVGSGYEICTSLEQTGLSSVSCGGSSLCGSSTCNYKVVNP